MFKSVRFDESANAEAVAIACFAEEEPRTQQAEVAAKRPEWTGDVGQVLEVGGADEPRAFVFGLGDPLKFNPNEMRKAAAALARRCSQAKVSSLSLQYLNAIDGEAHGQAIGEAFGLIGWTSAQFRGQPDDRPEISLSSLEATVNRGIQKGLALAEAQNFARTLGNTPPNIATPAWMAEQAIKLGKEMGLEVTVIPFEELLDNKLIGIYTVGRASENKPCLVRIEYNPAKPEGNPVVLIGKTLCYDTGGLSLKDRAGMVGMKTDKCGGCAVLGAMMAVAMLKPKTRVVALLSVAENSVSSEAFRPDDVLTYMNGKTVEITNTDAEGRLVLADALCWAYAKENPQAVIDLATLTGGVWVALGSIRAGLFSDDPNLTSQLEQAGADTGEKVWHLPMDAEYDETMKSPVADLVNSGASRGGHPVQGAVFLRNFTQDSAPWAHLDIAGMAATDTDAGIYTKGATGFGVRLLARYFESQFGSAS